MQIVYLRYGAKGKQPAVILEKSKVPGKIRVRKYRANSHRLTQPMAVSESEIVRDERPSNHTRNLILAVLRADAS